MSVLLRTGTDWSWNGISQAIRALFRICLTTLLTVLWPFPQGVSLSGKEPAGAAAPSNFLIFLAEHQELVLDQD